MKFLSLSQFWLLAALILLPFMVSNDSLWLDEADTAMYALQPNFHTWFNNLMHDGQADCQMPLALLFSWIGGKICGTAEWQLRGINLIWGALAITGMYRVGQRLKIPWLPLLLAIQPYFWFYTNEARPYALQLAGGTWLMVALVEFYFASATGTAWAWQFAAAGFFLFCATLLAPLPVAMTVLAAGVIAWRRGWKPSHRAMMVLLGGLAACIPVGIYYLTTLMRGAKGAQVWHVDLKFVAYVVYELTGMGGIGLTDEEIRELARSPHLLGDLSAHAPQLAMPVLLLALLGAIIFLGGRRRSTNPFPNPLLIGLLLVPTLTAGVFIIGSLALQKAFWARHFAPVFPFFVVLLGLAMANVWTATRWRWLPLASCGLFVFSALNFRFAPALRKEDYRSASAFVRPLVGQNKSIWWFAGGLPLWYYGLDWSESFKPNQVLVMIHFHGDTAKLPLPDVIVCNRPDIHDPNGVVRKMVGQHDYLVAAKYKSFTIWTNGGGHF